MNARVTQFVGSVGKLPSLPSLYHELNTAVEDAGTALATIGDIVRKDQSLASRLLRIANSALYNFPSPVETIEEAVQLLGLRELRDLALATSVIGAFPRLPPGLVSVPEFWKHSLACAVAGGLLAERREDPTPERYFVGGLLHDIGRLVLYLKAPEQSAELLRQYAESDVPPCVLETRMLGFDHAELGAELLAIWKIPPVVAGMVRRHHDPSRGSGGIGDDATVHCADFLVTALGLGHSGEAVVSPVAEEAWKRCGLDDGQLGPLVETIEERCRQLWPVFTPEDVT